MIVLGNRRRLQTKLQEPDQPVRDETRSLPHLGNDLSQDTLLFVVAWLRAIHAADGTPSCISVVLVRLRPRRLPSPVLTARRATADHLFNERREYIHVSKDKNLQANVDDQRHVVRNREVGRALGPHQNHRCLLQGLQLSRDLRQMPHSRIFYSIQEHHRCTDVSYSNV